MTLKSTYKCTFFAPRIREAKTPFCFYGFRAAAQEPRVHGQTAEDDCLPRGGPHRRVLLHETGRPPAQSHHSAEGPVTGTGQYPGSGVP